MENKIHGYVYLITNLINNKQYVGQTVQTIEERFDNHRTAAKYKKTYIERTINKHGIDNFIVQELGIAYDQKQLDFIEGMYMSWFNTLAPNGYNIQKIINGRGKHSEETIEKMKKSANKPHRLKQLSENGKERRGKSTILKPEYIGVSKIDNKYCSRIGFNNKSIYLGSYNLNIDAAKAYDLKALELFGRDCVLNFTELRQDYIDGKININKNTRQDSSMSGIKNIIYVKCRNIWQYKYFDKILNKKRTKNFKTLQEAIEYKNNILN